MVNKFFHSSIGSVVITAITFAVPWFITNSALDTITVGSLLRGVVTWLKLKQA